MTLARLGPDDPEAVRTNESAGKDRRPYLRTLCWTTLQLLENYVSKKFKAPKNELPRSRKRVPLASNYLLRARLSKKSLIRWGFEVIAYGYGGCA